MANGEWRMGKAARPRLARFPIRHSPLSAPQARAPFADNEFN
jgi:hypothetical protein